MAGDDAADTAKTESGIEKAGTQGDLALAISIGESGLTTRFVYNSSVFQAGTIQWMSRHYHQLLQHAVCSPETRPDDLWLATPEELALVQQWGHGEPGPMRDLLYHERFQAQAEQRPEAVAVVYEGSQLTYREVDLRANQLAHHLQGLGVGPDVVVGLLMECSPELVVATLAVFKAGGAVFLLPPASPRARLSVLVTLAAPAVVVTKKRFGELLCDACPHVVYLDDSNSCLAQRPHTAPANRVNGKNLAFLFLTSGSTGEPKIVREPYGRLRKQSLAESSERYVLKSNTGTTFTASEIMAVTRGGTLFIAPDGIESDIRRLASFIR